MSNEKPKDFAPSESEDEKPTLRNYKADEEKAVAKEKLEFEIEPEENR